MIGYVVVLNIVPVEREYAYYIHSDEDDDNPSMKLIGYIFVKLNDVDSQHDNPLSMHMIFTYH